MSSASLREDPHHSESSDISSSHEREHTPSWEPRNLCVALESASRRASLHERQIKEFESKLTLELSNSRAIENLLHEMSHSIRQTSERAHFASSTTVPHIESSLEEDLAILNELEEQLPEVGSQIRDIRHVYDRGREKARDLMASLEWLNTPISQRLRAIIFTPNAPVSKKWKVAVVSLPPFVRLITAPAHISCPIISGRCSLSSSAHACGSHGSPSAAPSALTDNDWSGASAS
ncbi:hypothetical protein BN946_scf185036.g2 [Trametes cinnabarina]|uniref:Uncharacterized protein n=1 Tax=Pycnoporus cinnabarinus TaxID=5643 RepID=A0A060SS05_PYCCI|nr:hypothetical protein BN946_scf185036.g2 [Trametes cinnabarina]